MSSARGAGSARVRALAAIVLALGVATPLACAKGVGDGIFEDEKSEGGGGAGGAGGASDTGPGVGDGAADGPVGATDVGATSSTGPAASSVSSTAQSVAASSTIAAASSTQQAAAVVSSSSGGSNSTCCFANGGPGCDDPLIAGCVCLFDPYCCDVEWDAMCVGEVSLCGSC